MLNIIVAVADNNEIGNLGKIPWKLKEEQLHFQALTMGHTVIIGKTSFNTLKRNLPGRKVIVVTKDAKFKSPYNNVQIAFSPEAALELAGADTEIFIAGGAQIYKLFLDAANRIYLTQIYKKFDGDTFFPEINPLKWQLQEASEVYEDTNTKTSYRFLTYLKNSA
jgi:dihydrofolate reductase